MNKVSKRETDNTNTQKVGINDITIPLIPLEEQKRIVAILLEIDNEIEVLESKLAELKQHKLQVMADLLSDNSRKI